MSNERVYYKISTTLYNACVACHIKCPDFVGYKTKNQPDKIYASIGKDVFFIGLLCEDPVDLNMCSTGDLSPIEKMEQTASLTSYLVNGIDTRLIIVYNSRGAIYCDMTCYFRKWWATAVAGIQQGEP